MKIIEGKVTDINDPLKLSRIKVKFTLEHKDLKDNTNTEWIKPFFYAGKTNQGKHNPPELDSIVTVFVLDEYYLELRYFNNIYLKGNAVYNQFASKSSGITELGTQTYPQPKFEIKADGSVYFHNTQTGECGFIHKSGGYQIWDSSGKFYLKSGNNKIKIETAGLTINDNFQVLV